MNRQFMLTKLAMSRVIVQALYNMPELPAANHHAIKHQMKRKKEQLAISHRQAMKIIQDKI